MPAIFRKSSVALLLFAFMLADSASQAIEFDREAALETVKILSADEMGGRAVGTPGNAKARAFLLEKIADLGVETVGPTHEHRFRFTQQSGDDTQTEVIGTNLLFRINGSGNSGKTIVLSAHYDHVGTQGGEVFNGADDNASGVAALLAVAENFKHSPPVNDFIFALFDAEEVGLQGARAFVRNIALIDKNTAFNINFDMLSRNDRNELYVAGVFHRPALKPVIERVAQQAPVTLLMGHDDPALGANDWTLSSDHGPFHSAGVPFLYFGVEDHPHYHRASDDFETIPVDFFLRSVETVILATHEVDRSLATIVD